MTNLSTGFNFRCSRKEGGKNDLKNNDSAKQPNRSLTNIEIARRLADDKSELKGENLCGYDFSYEDLSEVDLIEADFSEAILKDCNFFGSNLQYTSFIGARLNKTNLQHTDLSNANLSNAKLSRADLRNANLTNASFRGAEFCETDLRGAFIKVSRSDEDMENYNNQSDPEIDECDDRIRNVRLNNLNLKKLTSINPFESVIVTNVSV